MSKYTEQQRDNHYRWVENNKERAKQIQNKASRKFRSNNIDELKEYSRNKTKKRRESFRIFIDRYKLAAGCFDCGYNSAPEALDFDHVEGIKRCSIKDSWCLSAKNKILELNKCVVRCANCHRVKTKRMQNSQ